MAFSWAEEAGSVFQKAAVNVSSVFILFCHGVIHSLTFPPNFPFPAFQTLDSIISNQYLHKIYYLFLSLFCIKTITELLTK